MLEKGSDAVGVSGGSTGRSRRVGVRRERKSAGELSWADSAGAASRGASVPGVARTERAGEPHFRRPSCPAAGRSCGAGELSEADPGPAVGGSAEELSWADSAGAASRGTSALGVARTERRRTPVPAPVLSGGGEVVRRRGTVRGGSGAWRGRLHRGTVLGGLGRGRVARDIGPRGGPDGAGRRTPVPAPVLSGGGEVARRRGTLRGGSGACRGRLHRGTVLGGLGRGRVARDIGPRGGPDRAGRGTPVPAPLLSGGGEVARRRELSTPDPGPGVGGSAG